MGTLQRLSCQQRSSSGGQVAIRGTVQVTRLTAVYMRVRPQPAKHSTRFSPHVTSYRVNINGGENHALMHRRPYGA